jgi:transposase-like protein
VGRRGIKEYRPAEALALIASDRGHGDLVCPSCSSAKICRTPPRDSADHPGRVTLHCDACGRTANYLVPGPESSSGRRVEPPPA